MDIGRSIAAPFRDPRWFGKLAIGALVGIVPLLNVALAGYGLEYLRRVSSGDDTLPEWSDLGRHWVRGFLVGVGVFVYMLPAVLIAVLGILPPLMASLSPSALIENDATPIVAALSGSMLFLVLALVYVVAASVLMQAGLVHFMMSDERLGAMFDFKTIWSKVTSGSGYFVAWVMSFAYILGMTVVSGFVGAALGMIPCVGAVLAFPAGLFLGEAANLMMNHTYGQYASKAYGTVSTWPPMAQSVAPAYSPVSYQSPTTPLPPIAPISPTVAAPSAASPTVAASSPQSSTAPIRPSMPTVTRLPSAASMAPLDVNSPESRGGAEPEDIPDVAPDPAGDVSAPAIFERETADSAEPERDALAASEEAETANSEVSEEDLEIEWTAPANGASEESGLADTPLPEAPAAAEAPAAKAPEPPAPPASTPGPTAAPAAAPRPAFIPAAPSAGTIIDRPGVVAGAALRVIRGAEVGRLFRLPQSDVKLGRDTSSGIVIEDGKVSREHAKMQYRDGAFRVVDMGSSNGTFVNEERVLSPVVLKEGDRLRLGDTVLHFTEM